MQTRVRCASGAIGRVCRLLLREVGGEVDALVFAGGIGEKGVELREAVVEKVKFLGFELDGGRNGKVGEGVVEDVGVQGEV